jgi:eukaryotic-like serine/threonine-protein kinase
VIGVDVTSRLLAGRYVLERMLGRGGIAMVYAGRDRRLDRQVAVKVVPVAVTKPVERDRFVREAQSAAGLCHPNAVAVFDVGEADGFLYIVMELVEGRTLADVIAEDGPLDPPQATSIAASVLAALGQAHVAGIVHRDVKPSNIMITYDGVVKLLDFGIARRLDDLAGEVTPAGEIFGTPTYLAPEQIEGRPTTPATDLYAVGVVLFEMLSGVAPFHGDNPLATARARLHAPAPDVRTERPDIPADLAVAIGKAIAEDPTQRFGSAVAMQAALSDSSTTVLQPSAADLAPTQVLRAGDYRGHRTWLWWLAGVAALTIAGLVAWNAATGLFSFITSGDPPESPAVRASATSSSAVTTTSTTAPTTIGGVIAALQARPDAYGRQHTSEIVAELVKIDQGDAPSERAAALLDDVAEWTANGEVTPATQTLLEPVIAPLIQSSGGDDDDNDGGNANGNGGGNGHGNGHGNGNGGNGHGNGRGHGKKD